MRLRNLKILIPIICSFLLPFTAPPIAAASHQNAILTIDIEELSRVINEGGNCLLVFMAAWCMPCIRELPDVNSLYDKFRVRGLRVIGISVDIDGPLAMQPIVNRLKVRFPVYWLGQAAIDAYDVRGIPFFIFIRDGMVVEKLMGQRSKAYLDEKIEVFLSVQ